MDEIRDFFSGPSASRPRKLRTPLTCGRRLTKEDITNQHNRPEEHRHSIVVSGTDYARDVKEKETQMYLQNEREREKGESMSRGLDSLEYLSSWGESMQNIGELNEEAMTEVYNKYSFQRKEDTNNLAINEFKQQILDRIRGFPVVIIEGPTGCGKTTQVPQWILDDCYQHRKPCKIIVTQPRRIAAISIAKRVAQERGWDVGGLVGYQVGLENQCTTDTRIHYVTTGILLQKLVSAKNMSEYTHIILDEVHERGQEMDFLLLVVKKLLYTVSPGVKVVLMSATFNIKSFADYFLMPTPKGLQMSSCLKIVKKEPMFTVKIFYLNHLNKFGSIVEKATPRNDEPGIAPEMHHLVIKLVNAFEHIDKQEDDYADRDEADLPSVLIFLPGINEIEELYGCLTDLALRAKICDAECAKYKWWVLPLHSTITADEQVRVFKRAPPGHRKIILATNIAESSITVPDIKYVIDYCLMKILSADQNTNFTSLYMSWAAKNNCEQRSGRAGRVRDGRVYRLLPEKFYNSLPYECEPEIVRCSLERLVLLSKMLDMGAPSDILALAMNPPDMSNIQRTVLVLKEVGALKKTLNGEWSSADGDLTYMGRIMAKLPLDVRVAKLVVLGHIFGCLEDSIIMAAAMSVKNIFSSPFRERLNAYNSKLTWADGSTSDCIAFLNVYKVWNHLRQQKYFKQQGTNELQWARRFYVQVRALRELDDMVRELKLRLSREGIEPLKGNNPWTKTELPLALKVIMAGAFYPQYFIQVSEDESREREAVRTLAGHNPRNTVYLKNFPFNQPGEIYANTLKKIIKKLIGDEPRVTFDKNGSNIYLTFADGSYFKSDKEKKNNDPTIPGQVLLPIYKAVKARQLRMEIRLPLLPPDKANELAEALELTKLDINKDLLVPRLPDIDDTHIPVRVSEFVTVSKFWVQHDDESTAVELQNIHAILNRKKLLAYTDAILPGLLVAVPHTDRQTTVICRARVVKCLPKDMYEVVLIDVGGVCSVHGSRVLQLPAGARRGAAAALPCVLAGVAPPPHAAGWPPQANQLFHATVSKPNLIAKVYSVVRGIVSVELLADDGMVNLNELLINHGYAVRCEESYESKLNHDLRQTQTELNMAQKRAYNKEQAEMAFQEIRQLEPISEKDCVTDVLLKGPSSPLETNLHNLMFASRDKLVHVEWNSVNSVLLDTDPQENYERLLVAAEVGQNQNQSKMTLRHTTLMPNILGLPAILALLFCPTAELRRDSSCSRYVSALCGLGSDASRRPLFPEHDLLVSLSGQLTLPDIGLINHIRHLMDYMLYCAEGQDEPSANDEYAPKLPAYIRENLIKLLTTRRKHCEKEAVPNEWEWRLVPEHELLEITDPDMVDRSVIYPLHAPQELKPMPTDLLMALKEDNDKLKLQVARTPISSSALLQCKLCNTQAMPAHAMRIHLYSNAHKEKEEDLSIFNS